MTALQELFSNIEDDKGLYEAWEWIMANKEKLLIKERLQIEMAWFHGNHTDIRPGFTPKSYFKNTYPNERS